MWDPDDVLRSQIGPAEQVLWAGRPPAGVRLRGSDAFLIPFSLLWGGFAIFWETMVIIGGHSVFFVLWGVPFVLLGLYFMFGRFLVDAEQRENTVYAVTSQRILIVSGVIRSKVTSLDLATLTDLSLTEHRSGGGTITFGRGQAMDRFNWWAWPGMGGWQLVPSFELSTGARAVYELIRSAQQPARHPIVAGGTHQTAGGVTGADVTSIKELSRAIEQRRQP